MPNPVGWALIPLQRQKGLDLHRQRCREALSGFQKAGPGAGCDQTEHTLSTQVGEPGWLPSLQVYRKKPD